jgi:hypothetical protein
MVNLVRNPHFAKGTDQWVKISNPTTYEVVNGFMHIVSQSGVRGFHQTNIGAQIGITHYFAIEYNVISGAIAGSFQGGNLPTTTGAGLYQKTFVPSGTNPLYIYSANQPAEFYINRLYIGLEEFRMPLATKVTLTVRDGSGHYSYPSIHVPDTATNADIVEVGQQFATLMDAVMDGVILAISSTQRVTLPGGLAAVVPSSDVEVGALLLMQTAIGTTARLRIPTIKDENISSGSDDVNLESTDMAPLVTFLEDGFVTQDTGQINIVEYRGEDITNVLAGAEDFQKTRRG